MAKPATKAIQIVKAFQEGGATDTATFIILCEDGSLWFFYPALEHKWELLTEIDEGRYCV